MAEGVLKQDPYSGHLFVFRGRDAKAGHLATTILKRQPQHIRRLTFHDSSHRRDQALPRLLVPRHNQIALAQCFNGNQTTRGQILDFGDRECRKVIDILVVLDKLPLQLRSCHNSLVVIRIRIHQETSKLFIYTV